MSIHAIDKKDAIAMCTQMEGHFFDRKAFPIQAAKIERICVAFANAEGGEVAIGIADKVDENTPLAGWKGADNVEKYNQILQAIFNLTPSIPFSYSLLATRGTRLPGPCATYRCSEKFDRTQYVRWDSVCTGKCPMPSDKRPGENSCPRFCEGYVFV